MTEPADRTDEQIAAELQERGLDIEYLRELSTALGFSSVEPWTLEIFLAMDGATPGDRRRAALRVLERGDGNAAP